MARASKDAVSAGRDGQNEEVIGMRRSIAAFAAFGAVVAGVGVATPASASATGSTSVAGFTADGCSAIMSGITRETVDGKAVVTFTGQVSCSSPATQIRLQTTIFNCWNLQPKAKRPWLLANCGYLSSAETFTPVQPGVTYTISSALSAAVDAYYAPQMSFNINGTTASGPDFGTPVLCSNGSCTNTTYVG
ncbi:hypothetical protein [Rugosimonospora africana]|uniref:Uncharacterized protein n=1 Tax=Rugosimonospora africana TaxID=556532 RepID=A0A8J3QSK5_9ACTN|nr:hypothetical protein [Rugosimonospora africana]GIH15467.1 hypothetical protein Raf01_36390 [Rugosimonospora africana]